jgi:hypothetical protein
VVAGRLLVKRFAVDPVVAHELRECFACVEHDETAIFTRLDHIDAASIDAISKAPTCSSVATTIATSPSLNALPMWLQTRRTSAWSSA